MSGVGLLTLEPIRAQILVYGLDAGTSRIEIQYGADLDRGIAPLVRFVPSGNAEDHCDLFGLNQASRYRVRARSVLADESRGEWSNIISFYTPLAQARVLTAATIMVEPALIVLPEETTWTSPTTEPGYPAAAVGIDAPSAAAWIRKSEEGFVIEAEHGGAPIDTLALLDTNISQACTVTIYGGPSLDNIRSGGALFKFGPVPFRASQDLEQRPGYHGLFRFGSSPAWKFWRIVVQGPVPGDLAVVTYAVLGKALVSHNYATGTLSEAPLDRGSIDRDRTGAPSRVSGQRSRAVNFDIVNIRQENAEVYRRLVNAIGSTGAVLVVPNSKPGAYLHDRILYGELDKTETTSTSAVHNDRSFSVRSLI